MEKDSALDALHPGELELFVQSMEPSRIDSIGNSGWVDWHIRLQKLNQQAVLEAVSMKEEATKEALISFGKLPVLVHEAICIQVWRTKVYPQIMKMDPELEHTFSIYMVLYHEAAAVGLLETVLFHEDGAQCVSEVLVDLVHYAADMLTTLYSLIQNGYLEHCEIRNEAETPAEEIERQRKELQFDIGMRCISIVRYIAEHMDSVGAGATIATNVYKTHDVPSLLAQLIQARPWRRETDDNQPKFFNYGRWLPATAEDLKQLHRYEAQLWLCLRQLLLEPRLPQYYSFDDVRRTTFCRIQSLLYDEMLDQIPPLGQLKQFLCHLSVGNYSALVSTNGWKKDPGSLLIEVVPQIKHNYLKQVHKKTKALAKFQLNCFKMDGSPESMEIAKKLLNSYASETALALDSGGPKCARCGEKASKKCSRCKVDWYCGRECQVQQWPKHKEICDQLCKALIN